MTRIALVDKKGVVQDVQIVGPKFKPPKDLTPYPSETANIGDTLAGDGSFIPAKRKITAEVLKADALQRIKFLIFRTWNFTLSDGTVVKSDMAPRTRTALSDLWSWGLRNPDGTRVWIDNDNGLTELTGKQLVELSDAVGDLHIKLYDTTSKIIEDISSKSPTIKTEAQLVEAQDKIFEGH